MLEQNFLYLCSSFCDLPVIVVKKGVRVFDDQESEMFLANLDPDLCSLQDLSRNVLLSRKEICACFFSYVPTITSCINAYSSYGWC